MAVRKTSYVTKITDISAVEIDGILYYEKGRDYGGGGGWKVGDTDLEEWLEKFADKYVHLSINTYERDESHLLPAVEPAGKAAANDA